VDQSGRFSDGTDENFRYRQLVDAISDYAIYMLDKTGLVSSWNAGAQRFKGYEAHEIVGKNFANFYTPEDRAAGAPQAALETATREGRFEKEGWRLRKDGTRFWAHVVIDPIRDPSGELIGFAKITRDLTERKEAETALIQSEQQFRLLVQGVTDYAIYMLDPTGRVSNWNAGAARIKGYTADEIVGQHFSQFYTEEDRAAGLPQVALDTARREGRFEKEGWRLRKDGSRFWAHVIIDPIRDDAGQVLGFAKVTRDITERRDAQKALEQAQQALFQSQKMESIGQLTGGIAHDFNNLLMAVLGSLELVQKRLVDNDPKTLSLLDNAVMGAQRGAALTRRMLAFARRQELTTESVGLPVLVQGMAGLIERSIGPSIRIRTRFPGDLPTVLTDANQLEAALINLAVNARDAMPDGGEITITAQAERLGAANRCGLPPGAYVCLSVADTGAGMDEATLAHAMEPFFTTKGIGKGTGLGLSMVHGLAEQSGGRLRIDSLPGVGTTVEMWLPVSGGVAAAMRPHRLQASPEPPTARMTVLAVDDDALVLMNTCAMLEDLGHTVLQAESGSEALHLLSARSDIALLITDQAMPEMTGLQLAEKATVMRADLPVILATGYAELPADADPALLRLAKPFTQAELAEVVGKAAQAVAPARG
jgi:PAS domain S-box-containing protein